MRFQDHIDNAKNGEDSLKANIIRKILSSNKDIIVEFGLESQNKSDILLEEKRLIAEHGRRDLGTGTLSNHTDGGDGGDTTTGLNEERLKERGEKISRGHHERSKEEKEKSSKRYSLAHKKNWKNCDREERKANIRIGIAKKRNKEEHATNVSSGHQNRSDAEKEKTAKLKSANAHRQWAKKRETMLERLNHTWEKNCISCILINESGQEIFVQNPNQWIKDFCEREGHNYHTTYNHLRKLIKGESIPKKSPLVRFSIKDY